MAQEPAQKKAKNSERSDSVWDYIEKLNEDGDIKCTKCSKEFGFKWHTKVERVRAHFGIDSEGNRQTTKSNEKTCPNNPYKNNIKASPAAAETVRPFLVPKLTEVERKKSNQHLANFFFETGTPFAKVEHPELKAIAKSLRPDA